MRTLSSLVAVLAVAAPAAAAGASTVVVIAEDGGRRDPPARPRGPGPRAVREERAHRHRDCAGVRAVPQPAGRRALRDRLGLAPLGGSIGWSYEARSWRLGILAQGAGDFGSFFGIEGAWIPFDADVSPYVGAGLGAVRGGFDASVGTKLEAGVEFFRLHGVRLMAGVSAIVPFDSGPGTPGVGWGLNLRCGF
jgi:hypothetical protein